MKKLTWSAPLLLLLLLSGCLSSESPFYEVKDVIQDPRFVGEFQSDDLPMAVSISASNVEKGRYVVRLVEGRGWSEYLATFFRTKNSIYVDLLPIGESNILTAYSEGTASASHLLKLISHDQSQNKTNKLHVIFRLEIAGSEIKFWGAKKGDDPTNIIVKDPKVKSRFNGDGVIVSELTKGLSSLLAQQDEGAGLFQANVVVLKRIAK